MKKIVLGLLLTSSVAMAADKNAEAKPKSENTVMSQLLEQALNSIAQSSLDVNVDGITFDSEAKESVKTDSIRLSGILNFDKDWLVELVPADPNDNGNSQIKKINPQLVADAKGLNLSVDVKVLPTVSSIDAKFFRNDGKTLIPRPLTLKIRNQMNTALMTIRLHSLQATQTVNEKDPTVKDVKGSCVSDKLLLDLKTGQNRIAQVDCQFSGTVTEKGYKLKFRYANR